MTVLSIIIVNWNTRDLLSQCLESVYATISGLDFELWVVDNASTDGSLLMLRQHFPGVQVIANSDNLGFACANNQALRLCQGEYALLLNSDAFLLPNAAQSLVAALQADPRAGIAGARLRYPDGRAQKSHARLPALSCELGSLLGLDRSLPRKLHLEREQRLPARATGVVSGACMLLRRTLWEQIGLFDENFFMFSEEVDLCKRAHQAGWRVLHVPSAQVIHIAAGSSGQTSRRVLHLYRAKLQYFEKHHGLRLSRVLFHSMRAFSRLKSWFYLPFNGKRAALWREVRLGLK
jgi:GT2 family glycosyltransferase